VSRALYQGKEVLRTDKGQCPDCRCGVIRVLVEEGGWRKWYAADIGNFGFEPHTCSPGGSSVRKAA
jgi:hypothetical protein